MNEMNEMKINGKWNFDGSVYWLKRIYCNGLIVEDIEEMNMLLESGWTNEEGIKLVFEGKGVRVFSLAYIKSVTK